MSDDDDMEATSGLENDLIDAARQLVEEHGYTEEDITRILAGTVFG